MSTISASTTSTTAFKITTDTTGALVFQTGASPTTAVTFDASQNVGVGNTSPSSTGVDTGIQRLVANAPNSNTGAAFLAIADSVGRTIRTSNQAKTIIGQLDSTSTGIAVGSTSNHPLFFNTNSTTQATIDTSGNFGIGTTSPSSALYVKRTSGNAGIYADYNGTNIGRLEAASNGNLYIGLTTGSGDISIGNTGNASAVVLSSGGVLGVGVTPSAWSSPFKTMQLGTYGQYIAGQTNTADLKLGANQYFNGTNYLYTVSGAGAAQYNISGNTGFQWNIAGSGTAGGTISFTQAMTLDASGNLGVGTTSPTSKLDVVTASAGGLNSRIYNSATSGNSYAQLQLQTDAGSFYIYKQNSTNSTNAGAGSVGLYADGAYPMVFYTNGTEAARITSGGVMYTGGFTSVSYAGIFNARRNSTNVGQAVVGFQQDGANSSEDFNLYASNGNYTNSSTPGWGQYRIINARGSSSVYNFATFQTSGGDVKFYFRGDGNAYADGTWNNNGADYAEYFESASGAELPVGTVVALEGNKVRPATEQDTHILGVVRPKAMGINSMVIGNTAFGHWSGKYLQDDFGCFIMEEYTVVEWVDDEGGTHAYQFDMVPEGLTPPEDAVHKTHDPDGVLFVRPKLNPAWDANAKYEDRETRPEWLIIGLLGQVRILKNQPVDPAWVKMRDISASVEEWFIK